MNAAGSVADPFEFEAATSTGGPAVPAGSWQVSVVSFTTKTFGAAMPPKVTVLIPAPFAWKPVPVSVIRIPPASGPLGGATIESVGSAL